jgi:hypothetical protein
VDINTIRAWRGHVSLNTTNVYAEIDLEMKAKALASCEIEEEAPQPPWRENQGYWSSCARCRPMDYVVLNLARKKTDGSHSGGGGT